MRCQECGEQIPEGKIYCERCGRAVQIVPDYNPVEDIAIGAEEEPEEEGLTRPAWWYRWRYWLAGVFLAVCGVTAYQLAYHASAPVEEVAEEPEESEPLTEPQFSIQPGTYNYSPMLRIAPAEEAEGKIYYTTDGTTPDETSSLYHSPIALGEGRTVVRAVFIRSDGLQSMEVSGTYEVVFDYPDEPVFSIPAGTYEEGLSVTITAEEGCSVYYTTNGEEPGKTSTLYQGPVYIPPGLTVLQAVAVDAEGGMSAIVEAIYNVSEISEPPSEEENGNPAEEPIIP